MRTLNLKPTHKAIKTYYNELQQLSLLDAHKEGAVSPAFANLLHHCARQFNWTLYEQYPLKHGTRNIYPDGALVDTFNLPYGYRETKDTLLHWIIDQYRVKTDKRSGIVNDPNRADEPDYIVNLIQRVITVSVETVKIVKGLLALEEMTIL